MNRSQGRNEKKRNMASSSPPSTNRATRSLAGTVAIVTGAGSAGQGIGNGRASALLLAEAGASVLCIDMNLEDAKNTVSMIDSETPSPQPFTTSSSSSTSDKRRAVALQADVTDEQQCKHAIDAALDLWGRLDILVNNVGIGGARGTAETVDKDDWAKGLEVNVTSMMLMAKFAVPAMRKNRIWSDDDDDGVTGDELSNTRMWRGSIVNMGSVAGIRGGTPHLLYPTAKGAVVVSSPSHGFTSSSSSPLFLPFSSSGYFSTG